MKKATTTASATKKAATKETVKPVTKKPAAKKAPVNKTAVKKTAAKKTAAKKTAAPKQAAPVAAKDPVTTIRAKIDIGFGNLLHLRGDGPGLSWEKGIVMDCVEDTIWSWTTTATVKPFTYKVLVNDLSWSTGEDYTAHAGKVNTIKPSLLILRGVVSPPFPARSP